MYEVWYYNTRKTALFKLTWKRSSPTDPLERSPAIWRSRSAANKYAKSHLSHRGYLVLKQSAPLCSPK